MSAVLKEQCPVDTQHGPETLRNLHRRTPFANLDCTVVLLRNFSLFGNHCASKTFPAPDFQKIYYLIPSCHDCHTNVSALLLT